MYVETNNMFMKCELREKGQTARHMYCFYKQFVISDKKPEKAQLQINNISISLPLCQNGTLGIPTIPPLT